MSDADKWRDTYRGYIIDYNPDNEDMNVFVEQGGVRVHTTKGYESALEWIDQKRRSELRKLQ